MGLLENIGRTPFVRIEGIDVKLEYLNPSGSVKDRIAKYIIEKAEKTGELKKGYTIIEATSGNTGIAFSMVCALKGYKFVAVMPKGFSNERREMMEAFGAEVILTKKECFDCAIEKTKEMSGKRTYLPRQFENEWNAEEHEIGLGPEILKQVGEKTPSIKTSKAVIDVFVAGVGTGGTVIGVGKFLKKHYPKTKVFAMEPLESHLLASSGIGKVYGKRPFGRCRHHNIEGIGDGIVPGLIRKHKDVLDGIIEIKSKEAIEMAKKLSKRGYFVGPSSGANFLAAKILKKDFENIVTLFPDSGDRYFGEVY